MVSVLEQPDSNRPAGGIVLAGLAEHFQKDFLGDILGFSGVAQNVRRDPVHEATISSEQRRERVSAGCLHSGDEFRVGPAILLIWTVDGTCRAHPGSSRSRL
jgi:hypothetical protein